MDILLNDKKVVVEYNGDFWHCNPKKYSSNYWNPKKEKYAYEIWGYDKERIDALQHFGYTVYVVWESDFKTNREKATKEILEKVNG